MVVNLLLSLLPSRGRDGVGDWCDGGSGCRHPDSSAGHRGVLQVKSTGRSAEGAGDDRPHQGRGATK